MNSSNTKILTIAVILLLLVNIAMIVFMIRGRGHHDVRREGGKGGPFEMLAKELNMTEQQKAEHQRLRDEYFATVRPLFDSIRKAKQAFFGLAKETNVSDSLMDSYLNRIAEKQSVVDKITLAHFRKVRDLYKGDQQKKYDEFVQKMMQRQGGPGGRKKDSTGKDK